MDDDLYLGLDLSTQQLKAIILNSHLSTVDELNISFDIDLPHFGTTNGAIHCEDLLSVTSPVLMWLEALDILLEKVKYSVDISKISAVGGCAQQHGTVYLKNGFSESLNNLSPEETFHSGLKDFFSVMECPIWMDNSTRDYCNFMEDVIGGPEKLTLLTGSRAYPRFSLHHINKFAKENNKAYQNTERICLVSNFIASLFIGHYAPIDFSDGSGMNLLDINQKDWAAALSNLYGIDVSSKLGSPAATMSTVGTISSYMIKRHGFSPNCRIASFTGDNPATLVGLCLSPNDIALSLGTSDVVIGLCDSASPSVDGHVFVSPLNPAQYMFILCYKNGSLVREQFRDEYCAGSWDVMNDILQSSEQSNSVGIYFPLPEIIPADLTGTFTSPSELSDSQKVQTLIEGQLLAKKAHLARLGFKQRPGSKLVAVGGGAASQGILNTAANIFNIDVYTMSTSDVASVGGAYLAFIQVHGLEEFSELIKAKNDLKLVCKPKIDKVADFERLSMEYAHLEDSAICSKPSN